MRPFTRISDRVIIFRFCKSIIINIIRYMRRLIVTTEKMLFSKPQYRGVGMTMTCNVIIGEGRRV